MKTFECRPKIITPEKRNSFDAYIVSIRIRQWSLLPLSSLQLHCLRLCLKVNGTIRHTSHHCRRCVSLCKFVEELDGPQELPLISRRAQCRHGSKMRRPSSLITERTAPMGERYAKLRCPITGLLIKTGFNILQHGFSVRTAILE